MRSRASRGRHWHFAPLANAGEWRRAIRTLAAADNLRLLVQRQHDSADFPVSQKKLKAPLKDRSFWWLRAGH